MGRLLSHRLAQKRHRMSLEGKLDHRDHQRAYRLRGGCVSDHTSKSRRPALPSIPDATRWTPRVPIRIPRFGVCRFCRRRGKVLSPAPVGAAITLLR
jgi:hypothetical protein